MVAVWIKCLLHKYEDLNLDLRKQCKDPGTVVYVYNPMAVGIETDDSLESTGQEAKKKIESDFLLDNKVEAWRDDSVGKKLVL